MKKLPYQFLRLPCQSGFRCVTHTPCDIGLMDRLVTVSVFTRNFIWSLTLSNVIHSFKTLFV